jgi:hypothetical protein
MEPSDLDNTQKAVLLALASVPTNHVRERLYFEKLLFLLTKADREELPDLDQSFEAYRFGMYSEYADEILERLDAVGLAEDYVLRPEGKDLVERISDDPGSRALVDAVSRVKRFTEGLDTSDLLYAAYRLYPELTLNSEIAHRIHSDKLEHFSIAVNSVREGEPTTSVSDKGNRVRVTRRGRRLEIEVP